MEKNSLRFWCNCGWIGHAVEFEKENTEGLYVYLVIAPVYTFFDRIKAAFQFALFGKQISLADVLISKEDVGKLKKFLEEKYDGE